MKCGFQKKVCTSKSPTSFSRKSLAGIYIDREDEIFTRMKTGTKIGIIISTIVILTLVILYFSSLQDNIKVGSSIFILIIAVFLYFGLAAFSPRRCKRCSNNRMKKHFAEEGFMPDYYYCENCNYIENTNIHLGTDI